MSCFATELASKKTIQWQLTSTRISYHEQAFYR